MSKEKKPNLQDMDIDANGFAAPTRFLMTDEFHRKMMEDQQVWRKKCHTNARLAQGAAVNGCALNDFLKKEKRCDIF